MSTLWGSYQNPTPLLPLARTAALPHLDGWDCLLTSSPGSRLSSAHPLGILLMKSESVSPPLRTPQCWAGREICGELRGQAEGKKDPRFPASCLCLLLAEGQTFQHKLQNHLQKTYSVFWERSAIRVLTQPTKNVEVKTRHTLRDFRGLVLQALSSVLWTWTVQSRWGSLLHYEEEMHWLILHHLKY